MHSPQSSSYHSYSYPFHQVIFLFLVCISDPSIGTRVAVLWFFITIVLGFPACWFLFKWPCMLLWLFVSHLSSFHLLYVLILKSYHLQLSSFPSHQSYTCSHHLSILLSPRSFTTPLLMPAVKLLRLRPSHHSAILPSQCFSILAPSSLSPVLRHP